MVGIVSRGGNRHAQLRCRLHENARTLQRGTHPANRTAVNLHRLHADEEPAVKARIPGEQGLVTIEIRLHILHPRYRAKSNERRPFSAMNIRRALSRPACPDRPRGRRRPSSSISQGGGIDGTHVHIENEGRDHDDRGRARSFTFRPFFARPDSTRSSSRGHAAAAPEQNIKSHDSTSLHVAP